MPKISIIVPVYNVEKYMERSINSILNQTYTDIEVLLIDDGSLDNSGKICDEFAEKDSRVKVFHKENGGVSSARNLGLDNATGDYIGFVDPDDIIDPNMYNVLLDNLISSESDISFCDYCCFSNYSEIDFVSNNNIKKYTRNELLKEALVPNTRICLMGTIWNRIYRFDVVKDIRFNEALKNGEDTEYAFNCIMKSEKLVMTDAKFYKYFVRNDGAVATQSSESRVNALSMRRGMLERVISECDEEIIKNIKSWYAFNLAGTYLNINKQHQKKLLKEVKKYYWSIIKCSQLHWKARILLTIKIVLM